MKIIAINEKPISTSAQLSSSSSLLGRRNIEKVKRNGQPLHFQTTLLSRDQAKNGGYLGVVPHRSETIHATCESRAIGWCGDNSARLTHETLKGVGSMIAQKLAASSGSLLVRRAEAGSQADWQVRAILAGPVGILGVLFLSVVNSATQSITSGASIISLTL